MIETPIGKQIYKKINSSKIRSEKSIPKTKYFVSLESLKKIEILIKKKVRKTMFKIKFLERIFQCSGMFF